MEIMFGTGSSNSSSPIIYFCAGALVPTLAYFLLLKRSPSVSKSSEELRANEDGFDDSDSDDGQQPLSISTEGDNPKNWGFKDAPYKMVLCVNQELKMGKGKVAAQCCHAAVGCYKKASKDCPSALKAWEYTGCAKIAVKCPTEEQMNVIMVKASEAGIPYCLVEDAGRTQIAAGSRTVIGIGPAPVRVFEGITSDLKLM
mmetsp:Transcript_20480/g.19707  ORF Transcript_20480/g.19707 Transcript_20480/m.19707 type:complete len:200 (-) Transcript_20480:177-776(-)|eukprot:CAMPEP_0197830888 /NCGR_PEP_ID=MMETSP1437-20131217/7496_1 /TAXON_ID=49252 ORGANISM="Eucampia antarctica, Strain CCMP1452" /NCGR_SAMPLE_ID=MMETSP1437 /ASSEMBLY_ACC=CAM_ASM_001096 /LENGTH=199 /DNA_ID=CAMNT_0043433563 /DNA_START=151 /DNA_END=750 /DNA_ORIENTATION=+